MSKSISIILLLIVSVVLTYSFNTIRPHAASLSLPKKRFVTKMVSTAVPVVTSSTLGGGMFLKYYNHYNIYHNIQ